MYRAMRDPLVSMWVADMSVYLTNEMDFLWIFYIAKEAARSRLPPRCQHLSPKHRSLNRAYKSIRFLSLELEAKG